MSKENDAKKLVHDLFSLKAGTNSEIQTEMTELLRGVTPDLAPYIMKEIFKVPEEGFDLINPHGACGNPLVGILDTISAFKVISPDILKDVAELMTWIDIVHQLDDSLISAIFAILRKQKFSSMLIRYRIDTYVSMMEGWKRDPEIIAMARKLQRNY